MSPNAVFEYASCDTPFLDSMSPNAVFEYAGDRDTIDDDAEKELAFQKTEPLTQKYVHNRLNKYVHKGSGISW